MKPNTAPGARAVDKLLNGDKPEAFHYGDREISAEEVPDVSAKPYLTIISSDKAKRQQALAEILKADFAKKFQIQARDFNARDVPADDARWLVKLSFLNLVARLEMEKLTPGINRCRGRAAVQICSEP